MTRQLLWLRNAVRYGPRGRWHRWIFNRSWYFLLIAYLMGYVATALAFARLYQVFGQVWDGSIGEHGGYAKDLKSLFYFSLITQTTLGYGDLSPRGDARLVAVVQTVIGTVINALGFGMIVLKLVQRKHNLVFPEVICYDRAHHQLVIWVWNRDAYSLYDLKHTLGVEKFLSDDADMGVRVRRYPLKIHRHQTFIDPMLGILVKTSSEGIEDPAAPPAVRSPEPSSVTMSSKDHLGRSLWEGGKLYLEIRAWVAESGDRIFAQKVFSFDQIVCGRYRDLSDGPFEEDWHYRLLERYGQIDPTQPEECASCCLRADCPLGPAREFRRRGGTTAPQSEGAEETA
jgi:hypothetical protein